PTKPSPSGNACSKPQKAKNHRNSSATTQATPTASNESNTGYQKPSGRTCLNTADLRGAPAALSNVSLRGALPRLTATEEVDEQPVGAFGLVVMHPVRRVGETLDAVEVGYVVVFRLGQVGAEVAIAIAPDDERGRGDRADVGLGLLRRLFHRGAVVVDHR